MSGDAASIQLQIAGGAAKLAGDGRIRRTLRFCLESPSAMTQIFSGQYDCQLD
jgi:hypothetical protein